MVGVVKKQKPPVARDVRVDGSRRPDVGQVDLCDELERRRLRGPPRILHKKIEIEIDLRGIGCEAFERAGQQLAKLFERLGLRAAMSCGLKSVTPACISSTRCS
jgi:hypothetical protein